jgi:hypothetical protein
MNGILAEPNDGHRQAIFLRHHTSAVNNVSQSQTRGSLTQPVLFWVICHEQARLVYSKLNYKLQRDR